MAEAWLGNLTEAVADLGSNGVPGLPSIKTKKLVVRNSDLIWAEKNVIRMVSMAQLKGGCSNSSNPIKTLQIPNLNFDIHSLALNHTKKLLAVSGTHQVLVIVLPRPGYANLVSPTLDSRSILIGQYYHALPGSSQLANVDWHPWSCSAASLLVLTRDSLLREYDVSLDSDEPQQSLSFTQHSAMPGSLSTPLSNHRSRGFSADDDRDDECVSFHLGCSSSDWGALTLYALMRNGDVYALCPFLPTHALVPINYIQNLRGVTEAKLLDPAHEDNGIVEARLNQQMRWLNAMAKQMHSLDGSATSFKCSSPRATGSILRQGPYLVQPPPSDDDEEADASDILAIRPSQLPMDVFVVVYTNGRVDVCLATDNVEGRWSSRAELAAQPPVMSTYETIQLVNGADVGYPSLEHDPVYEDTVYISHASGVHALVLKPWLDELAQTECITRDSKLIQVVQTGERDNAQSNPVVALDIVNDAFLGYFLLALTANLQLLPLALSLRVEETSGEGVEEKEHKKGAEGADHTSEHLKHYSSLLDAAHPIDLDAAHPIDLTRGLDGGHTRDAIAITPQTLRYLGGVVSNVRRHTHALTASANSVQDRLSLQLRESARQIDRLAHVAQVATNPSNQAGVGSGKGGRVHAVSLDQLALLARMDRLLQRLMDRHQPTLSVHETKWFEELARIRDEVGGSGGGKNGDAKGRALQARMSRLNHQLNILRPQVEAYQLGQAAKLTPSSAIGASQIAKVEGVLHEE
ncbi:hypothetical protein E3P96_04044 [Wallemia ichthyophaga]|nr:hypothetical protein E3P96_04044 [Wallemia ichthyophaga]